MPDAPLAGRRILLVIGGGIAAYKALELVRLIARAGGATTPVLTAAGREFVTPLTLGALAGSPVHETLFDLTSEVEMGHIQLSRAADLVVVAPATADLMAKAANGYANDLASTLLLATDKPVLMAPAMNVRMWEHPATRRNRATLAADGTLFVGPDEGEMACGEWGAGRMAEPPAILEAITAALGGTRSPAALGGTRSPAALGGTRSPAAQGPLTGRHVIITSGPTREPLDPVRYISNHSSGRQGTAIAEALSALGARVTFVTGPAEAPRPQGCTIVEIETARDMLAAVEAALPADAAIFAAAVADWRAADARPAKIKKTGAPPALALAENPDILAAIARGEGRPRLVIGFAAETENVAENARAKRQRKGCDWILANDVSTGSGTFGGADNAVTLITADGEETWPRAAKAEIARRLAARIAEALA